MQIDYETGARVDPADFVDLLHRSGLAERRPVHDSQCMRGMVENSNLVVAARIQGQLVGIARSLTDFHYACYLSDLAVDKDYQGQGIGRELQRLTRSQLGPHCKIIVIAAPAARSYYPKIGFDHNEACWVLPSDRIIGQR